MYIHINRFKAIVLGQNLSIYETKYLSMQTTAITTRTYIYMCIYMYIYT